MDADRLRNVKHIYSHASCPDGTSAAVLCALAIYFDKANRFPTQPVPYNEEEFWKMPEISFIQYGTNEMMELKPENGQLFVDITPPVERWQDWKDTDVIVLDHHPSARPATDGLGGVFGDHTQSGASLAYEHVMKPLVSLPMWNYYQPVSRLAAIRDTWQKDSPEWPEARAFALATQMFGSKQLIEGAKRGAFDFEAILKTGRSLREASDNKTALYARNSLIVEMNRASGDKFKAGIYNCTENTISDIGNLLLEERDCKLSIGFFILDEDGGPKFQVSLRSSKPGVPGRISAKLIAEKLGGGGHEPAAGFRVFDGMDFSIKKLVDMVQEAVLATGQ